MFWRKPTAFEIVLIDYVLGDRVGGARIPGWSVVVLQLDDGQSARADVRATPATARHGELGSDRDLLQFEPENQLLRIERQPERPGDYALFVNAR